MIFTPVISIGGKNADCEKKEQLVVLFDPMNFAPGKKTVIRNGSSAEWLKGFFPKNNLLFFLLAGFFLFLFLLLPDILFREFHGMVGLFFYFFQRSCFRFPDKNGNPENHGKSGKSGKNIKQGFEVFQRKGRGDGFVGCQRFVDRSAVPRRLKRHQRQNR